MCVLPPRMEPQPEIQHSFLVKSAGWRSGMAMGLTFLPSTGKARGNWTTAISFGTPPSPTPN